MSDKISVKLTHKPTLLSATEIAFKIPLSGAKHVISKEKEVNLKVRESGTCIGVIQWLGIQLYRDIYYENTPGEIPSHWSTPIYLFEQPLEVTAGQLLKIRASLFEDSVWFEHLK